MYSEKLVLSCFPNKEAILYNIETALSLQGFNERTEYLILCHNSLVNGKYEDAVEFSKKADYPLMAQAILFHYVYNNV